MVRVWEVLAAGGELAGAAGGAGGAVQGAGMPASSAAPPVGTQGHDMRSAQLTAPPPPAPPRGSSWCQRRLLSGFPARIPPTSTQSVRVGARQPRPGKLTQVSESKTRRPPLGARLCAGAQRIGCSQAYRATGQSAPRAGTQLQELC